MWVKISLFSEILQIVPACRNVEKLFFAAEFTTNLKIKASPLRRSWKIWRAIFLSAFHSILTAKNNNYVHFHLIHQQISKGCCKEKVSIFKSFTDSVTKKIFTFYFIFCCYIMQKHLRIKWTMYFFNCTTTKHVKKYIEVLVKENQVELSIAAASS